MEPVRRLGQEARGREVTEGSIGIDVKKGRGRYIDTCMVIFAPRYLLDNKSSHKLAFAQREFARGQVSSLLLKNDECLFNSTVNFNVILI